MRTLTSNIQAEIVKATRFPRCLAKLELGGSVGTKWISDRDMGSADGSTYANAIGCVKDWGVITAMLADDGRYAPVGDMVLTLIDSDATWHGWYQAVEFQAKTVTVYQWFTVQPGEMCYSAETGACGMACETGCESASELWLDEADLTPIFKGIVNDAPTWDDGDRIMTLMLADFSKKYDDTIGTIANDDTFPNINPEFNDEKSAILPIVFGEMKRSPCIAANAAPQTSLARSCWYNDTIIYTEDAEEFPQNTPISIRIGNEIIEGSFAGNTFTVTQRFAELVGGEVDAAIDDDAFDCISLSANDATYVGLYVKVEGTDTSPSYRRIIGYDGRLRRVHYQFPPFIKDGAYWTLPVGTAFEITSESENSCGHNKGATVYLVQDNYTYIVADHPCAAVTAIEGFGKVDDEQKGEDYIILDEDWYTVNLNDTTSFPQLDHAVTTVNFSRPPETLNTDLNDNAIWADVDGVENAGNGTGTVLENPADIIENLLTSSLFSGADSGVVDSASFSAAQTALAYLPMAFTLTEEKNLHEVTAQLAWQARSALNWNDGVAHLNVLYNNAGASDLTLDGDAFELGEVTRQYTSLRNIWSEVDATYTDKLEQKHVNAKDAVVEAALGRHVADRDFWAYRTKSSVVNAATFWLNRKKMIYEIVRLRCFLDALGLERCDTVTLDYTSLFDAGQKGLVTETRMAPGGGSFSQPPMIDVAIQLPRHAGCASICEANCETGGCESGCEFACEVGAESCWQCETQCETICELTSCQTGTENFCGYADAGCGESGPCGACETACVTGCELDTCETGCETGGEPANDCNSCDPAIPDTLYVTYAGLGGDLAAYNGKHTIAWTSTCAWTKIISASPSIYTQLYDFGSHWRIMLSLYGTGNIWWDDDGNQPCAPRSATFTLTDCVASAGGGWNDPDTCTTSASATAVVSTS